MGASYWGTDTQTTNTATGLPLVTDAWGSWIVENSPGDFTMWFDAPTGNTHYATSTDGTSWTDSGAIVVGALPPNTTAVNHAVVLRTDAVAATPYEMWYYTGIAGGDQLEGIQQLAHAYSADGITWQDFTTLTQPAAPQGQNPDLRILTGHTGANGWNNGTDGPGTIIYNASGSSTLDTTNAFNNKYVMYYDAYNKQSNTNSTGLAISTDGLSWQLFGGGPTIVGTGTGWDSTGTIIWSVFYEGGEYKAFYSAGTVAGEPWEGIGYATSTDGFTWTLDDTSNPIYSTADGVPYRTTENWIPRVVMITTETDKFYRMYFSVSDGTTGGLAYSNGPISAIPEPGTMALLLLGLGGLALKKRRRKAA